VRAMFACVVTVALVGCGSSSSSTDVSAWLGSWTVSATEAESCPPDTHSTPLTGVLLIVAGSASGTIVTEPANACNLTWTVSGNGATLTSTQTCSVFGSVGGQWTPTFTAGSLGLSGSTIALNDTGTATLAVTGFPVANCTFVQSGSFTR
jgi:hypothetical protein